MGSLARLSSDPCDVLQHTHGNVTDWKHSADSFVHNSTPSQRPNNGVEVDPMSSETFARKLPSRRHLTLAAVKSDLNDALRRGMPQYRVTAKEIAPFAECSEGTIENLRQRGVTDAMARLVLLGALSPELGRVIARYVAPGADLEPGWQEAIADIIRRHL